MYDFSIITETPTARALVQDRLLDRAFHDALFPNMLFRMAVSPIVFPGNLGDTIVQSATGLLPVDLRPLRPGNDPIPQVYEAEQWSATVQKYADTIDSDMCTSVVALANLFMENMQKLGLQAAQKMNRLVRNAMYRAGLGGHTVVTASALLAATTIRVARLQGFTTARRPDLPAGSPVMFDTVTVSNPLKIRLGPLGDANTVVGFTPDTAGDTTGPGTLTLGAGLATAMSARDYVLSDDRAKIIRVGGGLRVDDVTNTNLLTLTELRGALARFRRSNVPAMPDRRFHCHFDPSSEAQIFESAEFQRLLTAMPDSYMYQDFAIGALLGTVFFRNNEVPLPETVINTGGNPAGYSPADPFPGELTNPAGVTIHRPIFYGQGGIFEYYLELDALLTDAGVQGKIAEPRITNNGVEVNTDRVQVYIRAPQNRLGDKVSSTWKFIGDWPTRTDVTTGDAARYKRFLCIEHGGE
jgi:hypothetical protein